MPIEHVNGMSGISDYRDEEQQVPSFEQAQAEEFLLEYLLQNYEISQSQAAHVLGALHAAGENLPELVFELQQGSETAIARIETFVYQLG